MPRHGVTLPRVLGAAYKEKRADYVFKGERHESLELCYVDRGAVHAHVSTARGAPADLLLTAGMLMVWLPNEFHSLYAAKGPAPNIVTVAAIGPLPPGMDALSRRAVVLEPAERGWIRQLIDEQDQPGEASEAWRTALLTQLLVSVLRRVKAGRDETADAVGPGPAAGRPQGQNVRALQDMLAEEAAAEIGRCVEAGEDLQLADLATALRVSPSHLSHTFAAVRGQPVMAYLRERRIKRAAELLRDTALSIGEIASKCGFESPQAFSRAFKKGTGFTPTHYARSVRPE